jgi:hypothetical protein
LGIQFVHRKDGLFLHQIDYASSILEEFGMMECNPSKIPLPQNLKLRMDMNSSLINLQLYQWMVDKLVFLTNTRWDIVYILNLVSCFMTQSQLVHLQVVKSIIRYIKGTIHFGLFYGQLTKLKLFGFSDADWGGRGGYKDEQKSTRAYIFMINNTLITWCTKKQTCIVLSSTKLEYHALLEATKEVIWIKHLLRVWNFENRTN